MTDLLRTSRDRERVWPSKLEELLRNLKKTPSHAYASITIRIKPEIAERGYGGVVAINIPQGTTLRTKSGLPFVTFTDVTLRDLADVGHTVARAKDAGAIGNVGAMTITEIDDFDILEIFNPQPATGGMDIGQSAKEPPSWFELTLLDLRDERDKTLLYRGILMRLVLIDNHGTACQCQQCSEIPRYLIEEAYSHCDCHNKAEEGCGRTCDVNI